MDDTETDGTLLVAVGNARTSERLLDTATDIAADRSYRILIVHVVEVPAQIPLSEGDALLEEDDREVLARAEELVEGTDVPVDTVTRYTRDTATGIVSGAEEHGANLILMGWHGRPPRRDIVLGSYLDTVLRNAPCDVLVKRIRTPQADDVEAVLVPVANGPHARFATQVGGAIARHHDAQLTLLHVLSDDATDAERETGNELLERAEADLEGVSVERIVDEGDHISGRITDATTRHDVTILGASEQSLLRRKLIGTVSEAVGRNAAGTVMIAQRHPSATFREESLSE